MTNDTDEDRVLWMELNPYVLEATLFSSTTVTTPETTGGETETQSTGSSFSLEDRVIKNVTPVLRLEIDAGQSKSYFLRIKSLVAVLDLNFWNVEKFAEHESARQTMFGIWYGLITAMLLYNCFLYLSVKDKSYLYYCLYLVGVLLNQMGISGHSIYIASPQFASLFTQIFGIFYAFWAVQFVKSFLMTHLHPKTNRLLNLLLASLLIPCSFLITGDHKFSIISMNLLGIVIVFAIAIVGLSALQRGFVPARFFVLAWSLLLVGVFIFMLRGLGYIPSNIVTANSARIGSAIEVILLSIALADRINQFKREKQLEIDLKLEAFDKIKQMNAVFGKFVPHQFLELLDKRDLLDLAPGDHTQRVMTVLFSDIRAFTELSESMSPEENFNFINSYLGRMEPHIRKNNGFIDKFIGDAIMALFDESADNALKAAIEMINSLAVYNKHRSNCGYRALKIGIGINTGTLILGTVGDQTRMESTVISDAVNLASRIEGLCKTYGVCLLISQDTYLSLNNPENFHCRLIDQVQTKGKTNATVIYEVINADSMESGRKKVAKIKEFSKAVNLYRRQKYEDALPLFNEIAVDNTEDRPAAIYLSRCKDLLSSQ
ncbi:hypothetical protein A9Q99_26435 [Gammaproteobacteria bacterium 45_16_T64]|nr:hypothetical protein A9Q99_26435 [Gammaproteobacteria bacterium 45_16_T64]